MASFTFSSPGNFANGATLGAYPVSAWAGLRPSGSPLGSPTNTQTVTNQSVTFTGLTAGVDYYAAVNSSTTNYVRFTVPSTALNSDDLDSLAADVQEALDTKPTATLSTDGTLAANSDANVASQKAVKTYADGVATNLFAEAVARQYLDPVAQYGGHLAPNMPQGSVALTLTASRTYYCRFVATRSMNTTSISYNLSTAAGSNDNVDVGIINATTLARVASSGATAGKLNGPLTRTTVPLVAALTAGTIYYAAISCGAVGSTAAVITGTQFTTANFTKLLGLTNPGCQAWYEASATVPSTATFGSVAATAPFLFVE